MGRRHLGADAGLTAGHHRETEADDVDAEFERPGGEVLGQLRIAQHDGDDRMLARQKGEAGVGHGGPIADGVGEELFAQGVALLAARDPDGFDT